MESLFQQLAQELRSLRSNKSALPPERVAQRAIGILRLAIEKGALRDEPQLLILADIKRPTLDGMSADANPTDCWNVDDDVYAWDRVAGHVSGPDWMEMRKDDLGRMQSWLEACEPVARMIECSATPPDVASHTTRCDKLKIWAFNNWIVVAILAFVGVVAVIATLITNLETICNAIGWDIGRPRH